jgi:hypothetical protein
LSSVFQSWYHEMPWKMQSILANGLRAPDAKTRETKGLVRWMRTQVCHDADPNKPDCYMKAPTINNEYIEKAIKELEYLSCHYVHHLADAMRVLSIYHPQPDVRSTAWLVHYYVAEEIFHFLPELKDNFITRHRDKVAHE